MYTIDFAHNDYLQYLSELGAFAFLAGLLFSLRIFRHAIRSAMHEPSTDRRYIALACSGAFAAISLHSFVDFNLYIPSNAMLLAWIAGIAAASNSSRFLVTPVHPVVARHRSAQPEVPQATGAIYGEDGGHGKALFWLGLQLDKDGLARVGRWYQFRQGGLSPSGGR
jgi:O-antigen ligase